MKRHKYKISAVIKNVNISYELLYNIAIYFNKIYVENKQYKYAAINEANKLEEVNGQVFIPGSQMLIDKKL